MLEHLSFPKFPTCSQVLTLIFRFFRSGNPVKATKEYGKKKNNSKSMKEKNFQRIEKFYMRIVRMLRIKRSGQLFGNGQFPPNN